MNSSDNSRFCYRGIAGNEKADHLAKKARLELVRAERNWGEIMFGTEQDEELKSLRKDEWLDWHAMQGHDYYARTPTKPKHFLGMSRIDIYIIGQLRVGTDCGDHLDCDDGTDRYHILVCPKFARARPMRSTLFSDQHIPDWIKWANDHHYLGLGIPRSHASVDGVMLVGGNPFERTVWTRTGCHKPD